jgi:cytoplasmic iron level regulating protein YaaA (DUF328/UPF0246 family)
MKILLAPSESKERGGEDSFSPQSLLFETLLPKRMKILHAYTNVLQQGDMQVLSKMFGIKKEVDIRRYSADIIHELTMKSILRYTGVAFDYLDYKGLDKETQDYIDSHVILFSNLFGPLSASDLIPDYKLKQGESIADIKTEKFYNEHSRLLLEAYLAKDEVLDLRSGFYNKFYTPQKSYTTLKFIKEGKVVSHWAKAYRGIVLRAVAQNKIECIESLIKMEIANLRIKEIHIKKNHREIIYDICL